MAKVKEKSPEIDIADAAMPEPDDGKLSAKERKEQKKLEKEAKKEKKKREKAEKKKSRGFLSKMMPWILLFIVLGFIVAVIGYNFAGLRETYLRPIIDKIPVVNNLLPAPSEDEGGSAVATGMTREQLAAQVTQLESQIEQKNKQIDDLNKTIELNLDEIRELRESREEIDEFREEKAMFDREVATGNPVDYSKYYESIYPESASALYQQVIGTVQSSKEVTKWVQTVQSMDEAPAARMLENLLPADMNLVVRVLRNIGSDQSGAILASMTPENAAAVYKQMAPE